ncbi:MAG: DEAD/DEAH box helicase [Hyalangium sp.]|uniref:DEAD/DEAH box helicase n=1 Tax=Hyalangium sp. TaxID=2028555 RepID=UPI003899A242
MPSIRIRSHPSPAAITVERGADVPEDFWLRVQTEWGTSGRYSADVLETPLELFLSRLDWLKPTCQLHGVSVEWDERCKELLRAAIAEKQALRQSLSTPQPQDEGAAAARLERSRFFRELRPFQRRDLARLLSLRNGANFSVPGAGKTTVAYAIYEAERVAGRVARLLVVAPLSAFEAWEQEAVASLRPPPRVHRYGGGPIPGDCEVLLINYQRLAASMESLSAWLSARPAHLILDEAHRMKKGQAGQWGAACLRLSQLAARRDILTGTPAPQGTGDLEALFNFLWPGQARRLLPAAALSRNPPPDAGAQVARAIAPLFARTTKRELGLRAPQFNVLLVPMGKIHAQIYKALRDQYDGQFPLERRARLDLAQMGQVVMYLLEAATNPALLAVGASEYDPLEFRHPPLSIPEGSPLPRLLADYGTYETPRKFVELARLVRDNARLGRKTLVWTHFVRNLQILERQFAGLNPAVIHGGIPPAQSATGSGRTREQELARFREEPSCAVLLANPAATSEGISLHHWCHDAVYLERTFNAGQYLQSVDRIHRLGLGPDQETRITFLVSEGTIDEVVDRRVGEKAERLGTMLDDPDIRTMALPDDDDYGAALDSEEDLVALFAHLRGDK